MLGTYTYNEIFRKTVIGFGTLFNNIEIRRVSGSKTEVMKVHLAYGPKDKFLARLAQAGTTADRSTQISYPDYLLRYLDFHMILLERYHQLR